jgi:hypothetical protein
MSDVISTRANDVIPGILVDAGKSISSLRSAHDVAPIPQLQPGAWASAGQMIVLDPVLVVRPLRRLAEMFYQLAEQALAIK